MPRYDLKNLSSQDFEELVRDLLQAEWKVRLEAFKSGRDKGIDLRYAPAGNGTIIIQCKHYVGSGYSKLLSKLATEELPKIELLKPSRYIVVTSVALSPGNKNEIVAALSPFVVSASDIVSAGDLEGLLSKHPAVERSNFKLWLTSTNVIERVLHNAEICQTEFEIARIQRKVPLFVQGEAFPRAMALLEEGRVVLISGAPGIGKTTLAEMILYSHLEQGYEPVVIKEDIAEGKKFFRPDAKRIFYYDDFLGQFFLGDRGEYFGRNQDLAVVDFMEMVRGSANSRFILTTREHLLKSALLLSERLARSAIVEQRCLLELRDYSYAHKARILYNHLYFSGLPQAYKDVVLADDFFLKIIGHKHFNPRLIEWLSTDLRQRDVPSAEYQKYISRLLDSPHEIWMHAYRNQISDAARHILLSFYTLGEYVDIVDLEPTFRALHRHRAEKYHLSIGSNDFRDALQELDGAFLTYSSGHASYLNPSIREFVSSVVSEERDTAEDLLSAAIRFKQVTNVWRLAVARPGSVLASFLEQNPSKMIGVLTLLLFGPSIRWTKTPSGLRGYAVDMGEESRIEFLMELAEHLHSSDVCTRISEAVERLVAHWEGHVPYFHGVFRLLDGAPEHKWFMGTSGKTIVRRLLDGLLEHLHFAGASDWLELSDLPSKAVGWSPIDQSKLDAGFKRYEKDGVSDERRERTTEDEMSGLLESLTELAKKTNANFSYDINLLSESIAEGEERATSSAGGARYSAEVTITPAATDEDVRQMFSTLRDKSSD